MKKIHKVIKLGIAICGVVGFFAEWKIASNLEYAILTKQPYSINNKLKWVAIICLGIFLFYCLLVFLKSNKEELEIWTVIVNDNRVVVYDSYSQVKLKRYCKTFEDKEHALQYADNFKRIWSWKANILIKENIENNNNETSIA